MKKHRLHLIALVLTLAFCMQLPASALAASKITLKSGAAAPSTIYALHSYPLKVAGTSVKWVSSNKNIATIGQATGKLKPVAPGQVKITAKSINTGKAVATKTFKVLLRATDVSVSPSELTLSVGETATLGRDAHAEQQHRRGSLLFRRQRHRHRRPEQRQGHGQKSRRNDHYRLCQSD